MEQRGHMMAAKHRGPRLVGGGVHAACRAAFLGGAAVVEIVPV